MTLTFAEFKKTAVGYKKMLDEQEEIRKKVNEASRLLNEMIQNNAVPPKALYNRIRAFAESNGLLGIDSVSEWIDKADLALQKGVKYKGFVIKVRTYCTCPNIKSFVIYENGTPNDFLNSNSNLKTEEDCKAYIDLYFEIKKKIPTLLEKLGISKMYYNEKQAKRSYVFESYKVNIIDDLLFQRNLLKFWHTYPDFSKWKVETVHNKCSLSDEELAYEIRSECEYSYCEGDGVTITATEKPVGNEYPRNEIRWGLGN